MATARARASWAHPRSRGENSGPCTARPILGGSSPLTRGKRPYERGRAEPRGLIPAHAGKTPSYELYRRASAAHPRSRGENAGFRWSSDEVVGSSPLTRGKLPARDTRARRGRLIPAHAGKTSRSRSRRAGRRAHPRSRGENSDPQPLPLTWSGSSPLTRGKPRWTLLPLESRGLIPAHAGKTEAHCLVPSGV
ncbi:hypothetical protein ACTODO_00515 [Schaalia dentiphila ATCC 17982]|nr:hypothetical protein ACTODO_00515 [Schaalia odontolytica ATCC 17982]